MRLRAPSRGLALSAALLLTLTACNGGSPGEDGSASPTTTAPASATDGTESEESGSDKSESSEASESESTEPSDTESTEAGGSDDGESDGNDGEYVPASADGPAQNVPKPQMPEEMKQETEEGAKAAVQYWWDTVYYLQQTGDAEPMLAVSSEDCNYCRRYSIAVTKVYEGGAWHSGTSPSVTSTLIATLNKEKRAVAATSLISFNEGIHYKSDGEINTEDTREAAEDEPWMIDLRFNTDKNRWDVTYVSYEGSNEHE